MRFSQAMLAATLVLGGAIAQADPCKLTIESNDAMQFSTHELEVPSQCTEVEVTLKNTGHLAASVMGHDWVLAKVADMPAIVNAGLAAGRAHGFLPVNDPRVIAATGLVGGGESTTIRFSTAALAPGERYVFFCTSPGHSTVMRGRFFFGDSTRVARSDR